MINKQNIYDLFCIYISLYLFCSLSLSLTYTIEDWKRKKREINIKGVKGVRPGEKCYVNLRAWGWGYVESIGLPDILNKDYVVTCEYIKWTNKKRLKIDVRCGLFNQLFEWAVDVEAYGKQLALTEDMILVDHNLCEMYPKILGQVILNLLRKNGGNVRHILGMR